MTSEKAADDAEQGYDRGLGSRHIQMIAIGGAIGVGLFLGAGANIAKAGPSIILMYALAGVIAFLIMRALGELLLYRPVSGSFAEYSREFLGPFFGYFTAWTYWLMWVVAGMAELTAAAIYVNYWFPSIPQWVTALTFLVVLFVANLVSVKIFGELEFWFSMVKVTAVIGVIMIGLGVLTLGFSAAGDTASVANLWQFDGFFPQGIGSSLMTLQGVMFAYLGIELVGVTAGESKNPVKTLPKAINTMPWRIMLFYVGALTVILCLVKWTRFSSGVSPFVKMLDVIGIPAGAGIVNFVVLTASLSSCNSGLYCTGRMLRTLADHGEAPRVFSRLSSTRTPVLGIAVSALIMGVGVGLNYVTPHKAFDYVVSVATAGGIWLWLMILISHLLYRRAFRAGRLSPSPFPAPGGALNSWVALVFLLFVTGLIAADAGTRVCLYVMGLWALVLGGSWLVLKDRMPQISECKQPVLEKLD
ncbi:amino acid permease [Streptomyces sp. NPDC048191]|uniref:amino acid permease n=1 Tax=Streptomyces sp. NPDC048191 TaxID=3155484 RepID=UPI0033CDCDF7